MKMKTLVLALGMSLAFQVASANNVRSVDNIVAVVENEVITQRELDQAVAHTRSQMPRGTQVSEQELQRQTLMQLVNQSLLVQAGRRNNIQVPDAEVEAEIARIAASRRQSVAQFEAAQARFGIDKTALRRQVRDSMIAQRVQQGQTAGEAKVSEDEINAAIARARAQGITLPQATPKTQYHAQHILIASQGERAQRLAQRLAQNAQRGADFSALARQYSQDGSAANGGDLGVIRLVEARTPNTPDARIRAGVHDAIAAQKTQAAMQGLLQQLHQNSFISIRMQ